jgi:peptidyl-prolyl cis-trans isomerase A (cyclophilin A)
MDEALAGLPEGALGAELHTDAGVVHCTLFVDTAPLTVASFVGLARGLRPYQEMNGGPWITGPFYENLPFHRAFAGQFVQSGRRGDQETPGFVLQDERSIGDAFDRPGKLALANAGVDHSGAAQFFVTTDDLRSFDGKYTIFGRCGDPLIVRDLERRTLAGEMPVLQRVEIVVAQD